MKVLKFGGTSLAKAERMKQVASIVLSQLEQSNDKKILVILSAIAGTTDTLLHIADLLESNKNNKEKTEKSKFYIDQLKSLYEGYIRDLLTTEAIRKTATVSVEQLLVQVDQVSLEEPDFKSRILATGELISTQLFHYLLVELKQSVHYLSSLEYLRLSNNSQPDEVYIKDKLQAVINENKHAEIFIAQGFICRTALGHISNLKRGGSDYTASLFAAAIHSDEIQIWTDIDGMHNNDPRYVSNTDPIRHLSFDEAAELAYFGAKILHPSSIKPARKNNIPVRLLNTLEPSAQGTLISDAIANNGSISDTISIENTSSSSNPLSNSRIKAIAAKDGITAIKIRSSEMLQAPGFLRQIFEVFELYQTSIDVITTSEVAVSLTIDDTRHLDAITQTLQAFAHIEVDQQLTIICVVGELLSQSRGIANSILGSLKEIPIRMISYGGSPHNMTLLIKQAYKSQALHALHQELF
jgi:aspartate kinase